MLINLMGILFEYVVGFTLLYLIYHVCVSIKRFRGKHHVG